MNPLENHSIDTTAISGFSPPEAESRYLGGNSVGGQSFGASSSLPSPVLSGIAVTPETALTFTAFFACINVRSTDLASLPLEVKRRRRTGGVVPAVNDPRYNLVFSEPNKRSSSMRFRQALLGHRHGWGNGYAEIIRRNGLPVELLLHSPRDTDTWPVLSKSGDLWYKVDAGKREVRAENMIHVAGLGWNGIKGYSNVALHKQAVGYGIALEQFGAAFYGNAMTPRGAIKVPKKLTPEMLKNMRESYSLVHTDTTNAHRLMILEEGTEFQNFSCDPKDAEYIATRQFQANEMCMIMRVPPARIMLTNGLTGVYKAFDDMIQDYVSSTLGPDAEDLEQEFNRKLFTARERAHGLHCAHDWMGLLRGNMQSRADYYTKRFGLGSITPDEVREREGDNPIDSPASKKTYVSTNFVPLEMSGQGGPKPSGDKPAEVVEPTPDDLESGITE